MRVRQEHLAAVLDPALGGVSDDVRTGVLARSLEQETLASWKAYRALVDLLEQEFLLVTQVGLSVVAQTAEE